MDRLMQRVINGQLNNDETKNKSIKEQKDELNKKRFLAAINEMEWRAPIGQRFVHSNDFDLMMMKHGVKFEGGNLFE